MLSGPVSGASGPHEFKALIDSVSKVNTMTLIYTAKLGLRPRPTNVNAQKIDGSILKTYDMIPARLLLQNSQRRVQFLEETFLLDDTSMEILLEILYLALNNTDVKFTEQPKTLTWRLYTVTKVLLTTGRVEFINKREFSKAALDKNSETFIMYVAALEMMSIHLS